jgi:hypothetical protein
MVTDLCVALGAAPVSHLQVRTAGSSSSSSSKLNGSCCDHQHRRMPSLGYALFAKLVSYLQARTQQQQQQHNLLT